jgi:hypothetical protein
LDRPSSLAVPAATLPATASASVVPTSDNAFDELDATRGTAWQFELARLKQTNKKLKEEKALLAEKRRNREMVGGMVNRKRSREESCTRCGSGESTSWSRSVSGDFLCES